MHPVRQDVPATSVAVPDPMTMQPLSLPPVRPKRVYRRLALPQGWVRCEGCGHLVELPRTSPAPLLCSECEWEAAR